MKRLFLTAIAAGIIGLSGSAALAQNRNFGARTFTMDDGAGHSYTMQTPAGMTGPLTYTFPTPPPGNPQAGFVNVGTIAGQTLFWNGTNMAWEASSVITNNLNGNGTGVSITAPLSGVLGSQFTGSGVGNILTISNAGAGDGLTVSNSGSGKALNATGPVAINGTLSTTGTVTLANLATAGVVHNSAAGLLSTGSVALGAGGDVSGVLPIANGGTGSAIQNFVDLSNAQTVGGAKTFTAATTANNFASSGATITGGSINSTTVGAGTASTGAFTTLASSGLATLNSLAVTNAATVGGTLGVTGVSTLAATNITGVTTHNGAVNLNGANSPLQSNGAVGAANTLLQSAGPGNTPTWTNSINGTSISGSTGSFTTLGASTSETFSNLIAAGVVHNAAGGLLSTSAVNLASADVSGVLPIANGGTGSATQNFVDLTTAQSVGGAKTFTAATTANTFASSGATITGGSITGTSISGSTGSFTTLAASGATTLAGLTSTGITSSPISGSTGSFTTLAAATSETFSNLGAAGLVHNAAGGALSTSLLVNADITPGTIQNGSLQSSTITVTGGTGLGVAGSPVSLGGTVTLSNTGVTSNVAGTGISVSGATGAVTIGNTGVLSVARAADVIYAPFTLATGAVNVSPALNPQSNNTFLAGPSAGGPLAPIFRTIVAGDIPSLAGSYIQNQTGVAQAGAGFNTTGSGQVGSTFVAGTGITSTTGNIGATAGTVNAGAGGSLFSGSGGAFMLNLNNTGTGGGLTVNLAAGSSVPAINISNSGAANDILGTSGWSITKTGAITSTGLNATAGTIQTTGAIQGGSGTFNTMAGTGANHYANRVATTGVATQTFANTNVTAGSVIIFTYEGPSGGGQFTGIVNNRVVGTSFDITFSAVPAALSFINYIIIN
jgi:hypothetical protein